MLRGRHRRKLQRRFETAGPGAARHKANDVYAAGRDAHLPLPEAFTHVSVRLPAPFGLFLSGIADELKKADGRTLSEIWKAEEQKYIKKLHLTRTDLEQLETLGEVLGYLDTEMQLAAIRLYLEQLEQSLAEAQEQMGSRQRLYQSLGIAGGVFLVILLL